MNMNRIGLIVTIVGTFCLVWFLICFAIFKWDILEVNQSMGIIGSILIVGGLNVMQQGSKSKR